MDNRKPNRIGPKRPTGPAVTVSQNFDRITPVAGDASKLKTPIAEIGGLISQDFLDALDRAEDTPYVDRQFDRELANKVGEAASFLDSELKNLPPHVAINTLTWLRDNYLYHLQNRVVDLNKATEYYRFISESAVQALPPTVGYREEGLEHY